MVAIILLLDCLLRRFDQMAGQDPRLVNPHICLCFLVSKFEPPACNYSAEIDNTGS